MEWENGAGWEWAGGAGAKEVRKGLQLGPLGIGSFEVLLFDVLIGTPESCEAVCFFFLPEARRGCGLGSLGREGHGPLGKTRRGLNLAHSGWAAWQSCYLMFLIGYPESCEAVCFFFFPEARASGRRSWAIGEDKEGPELGPFRVGSLAVLGV